MEGSFLISSHIEPRPCLSLRRLTEWMFVSLACTCRSMARIAKLQTQGKVCFLKCIFPVAFFLTHSSLLVVREKGFILPWKKFSEGSLVMQ